MPPIISYQSGVTIGGDTIFPAQGNHFLDGVVTLRFENIDSLIITHGSGTGPNPGYIQISEIVINDNILSSNDIVGKDLKIIQLNNGLEIAGIEQSPVEVLVYNISGERIASQHSYISNQLNVTWDKRISSGVYLISFRSNDKHFVRKFFIE